MQINTLTIHSSSSLISLQNPNFNRHNNSQSSFPINKHLVVSCINGSLFSSALQFSNAKKYHRNRFPSNCISSGKDIAIDNDTVAESGSDNLLTSAEIEVQRKGLENQTIWNQIKEIVKFSGPATGLWLCGPLLSLMDTVIIGQQSSVELAALGPGTVLCDYMSYLFMFLSVATSNLVATALARQDKKDVQHQISVLLSIGLACGILMLVYTRFFGSWALTAFTGPKNAHLVPAANTYVQIRGYAWPAIIVGWVAQSASLGMKDSWGPLKALAVSTFINLVGAVGLCCFLGYGIAGAAWAAMVSQVIAGYMMIEALNNKGYNALAFSAPTLNELGIVAGIAAPVFVTMMSKVAFYSLLIYFATSMGTNSVAAHQVMLQTYTMCTVWGEPLSQTAQSFMPELMYGSNRSLVKARMLLKSLMIIGATLGGMLGVIGTSVPWLFPNFFTPDQNVIQEMHKVLLPYFLALAVTPSTHSLEGTLMAGRDLKFLSLSMTGCLAFGALILTLVSSWGYGLAGCWFSLVCFQWSRFFIALQRVLSRDGVMYSDDLSRFKTGKLKTSL